MAAKSKFDFLGKQHARTKILRAVKDALVEDKARIYHMGRQASMMDYTKAITEKLRENVGAYGTCNRSTGQLIIGVLVREGGEPFWTLLGEVMGPLRWFFQLVE